MNILRKQDGIGMISGIILLAFIISILLIGIKIAKLYVDCDRMTNDLKQFKIDTLMQTKVFNSEDVKNELLKRLHLQNMPEITADEINVTQVDKNYKIVIKHQFKEEIAENLYIMRVVNEEFYMPVTAL